MKASHKQVALLFTWLLPMPALTVVFRNRCAYRFPRCMEQPLAAVFQSSDVCESDHESRGLRFGRGPWSWQAVVVINLLHWLLKTSRLRDKQQRCLLLSVESFAESLSNGLGEQRVTDECLGCEPSGAVSKSTEAARTFRWQP